MVIFKLCHPYFGFIDARFPNFLITSFKIGFQVVYELFNLKENIEAFYYKSINNAESGAIMMRYGINEVFTLTYDSEHKRFSLTLCKGNGVIEFMTFDFAKYNQSDAPQSHHKNHLVDDIMDFIEAVYE